MAHKFQLLSVATTRPKSDTRFVMFQGGADATYYTQKLTLLTGRNGSGKSGLLRDIIEIFRSLSKQKRFLGAVGVRNGKKLHVGRIEYLVDNRTVSITRAAVSKFVISCDPPAERIDQILPTKIIGISSASVEKIPTSDDVDFENQTRFEAAATGRKYAYAYLGLHPSGQRASAKEALFRSIELVAWNSIFDQKRQRLDKIFRAANYRPFLALRFEVSRLFKSKSKWLVADPENPASDYGNSYEEFKAATARAYEKWQSSKNAPGRTTIARGIVRIYESDDREELLGTLWSALTKVKSQTGDMQSLTINFDFEREVLRNESRELRNLRLLHRYGFLELEEVKLIKVGEPFTQIDLMDASSGELSILQSLFGLAAMGESGSLVLIDEPENSLHPQWQSQYVELLNIVLSDMPGSHILMATHSPIVVSSSALFDVGYVPLEEGPRIQERSARSLAHRSSDFVLISCFGTVTENNEYVRHRILEALNLAETGQTESDHFRYLQRFFQSIRDAVPKGDPMRDVIIALANGPSAKW